MTEPAPWLLSWAHIAFMAIIMCSTLQDPPRSHRDLLHSDAIVSLVLRETLEWHCLRGWFQVVIMRKDISAAEQVASYGPNEALLRGKNGVYILSGWNFQKKDNILWHLKIIWYSNNSTWSKYWAPAVCQAQFQASGTYNRISAIPGCVHSYGEGCLYFFLICPGFSPMLREIIVRLNRNDLAVELIYARSGWSSSSTTVP